MSGYQKLALYLFGIIFNCGISINRQGTNTLSCTSLEQFHSQTPVPDNYLVEELEIVGSNERETLKSHSFAQHPQLKTIMLTNTIRDVEPNALSGLTDIRTVFMNKNNIPVLKANSFNHSGLFSLSIHSSKIQEIEPGTFGNIFAIYINDNKISKIKKGVFTNRNTSFLNFEENQISEIEDGAFQGMKKLLYLNLERNRLKHLNIENIFDKENNLKYLYLGNNLLSQIDGNMFDLVPNLLFLSINNNSISVLPKNLFKNLEKLEILDLHHNNLTEIDTDLFPLKNKLKYLFVNNNNLTFISPKFLDNVHLTNLAIYNNPLQCSCKNDLEIWNKENNTKIYCWEDIKCINHTNICNFDIKDVKYEILKSIDCDDASEDKLFLNNDFFTEIFSF